MKQEYTNIAFISYKREDEKWAKWLQKKLESYRIPTTIRDENTSLPKNDLHNHNQTIILLNYEQE